MTTMKLEFVWLALGIIVLLLLGICIIEAIIIFEPGAAAFCNCANLTNYTINAGTGTFTTTTG